MWFVYLQRWSLLGGLRVSGTRSSTCLERNDLCEGLPDRRVVLLKVYNVDVHEFCIIKCNKEVVSYWSMNGEEWKLICCSRELLTISIIWCCGVATCRRSTCTNVHCRHTSLLWLPWKSILQQPKIFADFQQKVLLNWLCLEIWAHKFHELECTIKSP